MQKVLIVLSVILSIILISCAPKEVPTPPEIVIDGDNLAGQERELRRTIATGPKSAAAHLALAEVLVLQDKIPEGIIHFDLARQIDGSRKQEIRDTRARLATDLSKQARAAYQQGNLNRAGAVLHNVELLDPYEATASILRGEIAQDQGHSDEAIIHFRKAIDRNHSATVESYLQDALVSSARSAAEAQDQRIALEYLHEARLLAPTPELDYLIGTVSYAWANTLEGPESMVHLKEAGAAFERVLRVTPDDQDAAYNLGAVLLAQDRYAEAVDLYYGLLSHHPKDGELYQALSMAHGRMEQGPLALAENAAGQALRAEEPVEDPLEWALRSARRFPGSDLESTWRNLGTPKEVYTYQDQGGNLTELWCYWSRKMILVFQDGARLGEPVSLEKP